MLKLNKMKRGLDSNYLYIVYTLLSCLGLLFFLGISSSITYKVFSTDTYLSLHFFSELLSILIAFSIFTILYYTFDIFNNLRSILLANTYLAMGAIDIFHTLSYKGMPIFFTVSNTAQRATTYWIIARTVMAVGLLISSIVKGEKTTKIKKELFLLTSLLIISVTFYLVTFKIEIIPALFIEGIGLTKLKVFMEYVIISLQILTAILCLLEYRQSRQKFVMGMAMALIINVFSELTFTLYNNVYDTYNFVGHGFKIMSYFVMFRILFIANIKRPYVRLSEMQTQLELYVDNLEEIVEEKTRELTNANKELTNINAKLLQGIESAKGIQQSLLPRKEQGFNEIHFYSDYIPCQRLSGDFYNYFRIDEDNIGMYIVDVSGHGLPAAMVTVFAARSLTNGKDVFSKGNYSILNPKEVLENFYYIFNSSNFPDETHLVMMYGIYNKKTKVLRYSSAGHNCSPIHISSAGECKVLNTSTGFPICKLGDFYTPEYENYELKLAKGDQILFYTDGITELKNRNEEIYSTKGLVKHIEENRNLKGEDLINSITEKLSIHKGPNDIEDDITLFVMSVDK